MARRFAAALAMPFVLVGVNAASAAETRAPNPVSRIGTTDKICQLTGDTDWETGRPTPGRTFANFGLDAVDLGYPVEHAGKLILLFGDSWPPPHPSGVAADVPPDDAVGVVVRRDAPTNDGKCLEMQVHQKPGAAKRFAAATIIGPTPVKQGFFNVPSGGVSGADGLYAFFWTNHCADPNPLRASPDDPLGRPAANRKCPENDDSNSVGRGVMARSEDDGRTFSHVVPMPTGFVYSTAVNTALQADLPGDQRLGIFIFGVPRYRASVPYLAHAPIETLGSPATWQFFIGRVPNGQPKWATYQEWMRGAAAPGAERSPAWKPPGEPEIFVPVAKAGYCIGEFSITWNRPLGAWLMLHQCPRGVSARIAPAPWGPWSTPTEILGADDGVACRLVMTPEGCGNRRDFWPGRHENGKLVAGGFYAPYVLNRYTGAVAGNGPGRRSTIYWVVSSWNPYEVSVMRTTLQSDAR
jgi:Domain of unknown function (DUF4185)